MLLLLPSKLLLLLLLLKTPAAPAEKMKAKVEKVFDVATFVRC